MKEGRKEEKEGRKEGTNGIINTAGTRVERKEGTKDRKEGSKEGRKDRNAGTWDIKGVLTRKTKGK